MGNAASCLPHRSFLLPKQWMTWGNGTAWVWYHINAWQLQDHEVKITTGCAQGGRGEYFWLCSQDPCPLHCSHWVEMCLGRGQSSSVQKLLEIAFPGFIFYPVPGQFPNPLLWGHLSFFPATAWDHRTFPPGQMMILVSWPEIFVEMVKLPPPVPAVGRCGGWEEWWFARHRGLGSGFSEVESWILPSGASQRRYVLSRLCVAVVCWPFLFFSKASGDLIRVRVCMHMPLTPFLLQIGGAMWPQQQCLSAWTKSPGLEEEAMSCLFSEYFVCLRIPTESSHLASASCFGNQVVTLWEATSQLMSTSLCHGLLT